MHCEISELTKTVREFYSPNGNYFKLIENFTSTVRTLGAFPQFVSFNNRCESV